MIELEVADYCHNCRYFEPISREYVKIADDTNECIHSTIVECTHALHCRKIENAIRKELNIDD